MQRVVLVALVLFSAGLAGCAGETYRGAEFDVGGTPTKPTEVEPMRENMHLRYEASDGSYFEIHMEPASFPDAFGAMVPGYRIGVQEYDARYVDDSRFDGEAWSYFGVDACMTPIWHVPQNSERPASINFLHWRPYGIEDLPTFLILPPLDLVRGESVSTSPDGTRVEWSDVYSSWPGHTYYNGGIAAADYGANIVSALQPGPDAFGDTRESFAMWSWSHVPAYHVPRAIDPGSAKIHPLDYYLASATLDGDVVTGCDTFSTLPTKGETMQLTDDGNGYGYDYGRMRDALAAANDPLTRSIIPNVRGPSDWDVRTQFFEDYPDATLIGWGTNWREDSPPPHWWFTYGEEGADEVLSTGCGPVRSTIAAPSQEWQCSDSRREHWQVVTQFDWETTHIVSFEQMASLHELLLGGQPLQFSFHTQAESPGYRPRAVYASATTIIDASDDDWYPGSQIFLDAQTAGLDSFGGDLDAWGVPTTGLNGGAGSPT